MAASAGQNHGLGADLSLDDNLGGSSVSPRIERITLPSHRLVSARNAPRSYSRNNRRAYEASGRRLVWGSMVLKEGFGFSGFRHTLTAALGLALPLGLAAAAFADPPAASRLRLAQAAPGAGADALKARDKELEAARRA